MNAREPTVARLPEDLANQIAAGEVVERPASAVKELVENALDAGARTVHVAIDEGGVRRLEVSDDGSGMGPEDAVLALERHATSKIRALGDLDAIATFGFRGEALPAIASVSRLRVRTRRAEDREGTEIAVEGGALAAPRPSGGAAGTTVTVTDLFFNVPARRKFLKATATEAAHVGEVVLGAALAHPDVTFTLTRDGRLQREYLRVDSREDRVRSALREDKLTACVSVAGATRIEAYLAPPERARMGAGGLHLLVNGRCVRDRSLARAVAHAYGSMLEPGRYPSGVVYLDLPFDRVDVNVHPQKAEVRFADGRRLFELVARELGQQLARRDGPSAQREAVSFLPRMGSFEPARRHAPSAASGAPFPVIDALLPLRDGGSTPPSPAPRSALSEDELALLGEERFWASLRFLAQVRATYLVCEAPSGLFILDQHAAAERVTYDRLRRRQGSMAQQRLLAAEIVTLTEREVDALEGALATMDELGVAARRIGPDAVAVDAVPSLLRHADPQKLVRELSVELTSGESRAFAARVDRAIATMACHGSVRAGDALSREEAEALVRALDEVDFAGHCPHGRPVVTSVTWSELERRVGR